MIRVLARNPTMRRFILICIGCVVLFRTFFVQHAYTQEQEVILDARVVEVSEVVERDGLRIQVVKAEILKGEYKGTVQEVQVLFDSEFVRGLHISDRIKVSVLSIGDEILFQFYDFSRSRSYILLLALFIVILIAFVGLRGIKTLFPSITLAFFLVFALIPDKLPQIGVIGSLSLIGIISFATAWIRLKRNVLAVIVTISVILCLLLAFLVFMGFSQTAYVVPFAGTLNIISEDQFSDVISVMYLSIIFVPAGAVINASIQVTKHLSERFSNVSRESITQMIKEGVRVGQKISAGELNNLIMLMIGISLSGIYLIQREQELMSYWDNGWIALQVIYTVSAGLSILFIALITVAMWALTFRILQGRDRLKGQRIFGSMR